MAIYTLMYRITRNSEPLSTWYQMVQMRFHSFEILQQVAADIKSDHNLECDQEIELGFVIQDYGHVEAL